MWIVRTCETVGDAHYYEELYSVRYGIPKMVFYTKGRAMQLTQGHIDQLFKAINTASGAERLMAEHLLFSKFPHHRPFALHRGEFHRRYVWLTMFGADGLGQERQWYPQGQALTT